MKRSTVGCTGGLALSNQLDHHKGRPAVDILADTLYVAKVTLTSTGHASHGEVVLEIGRSFEDYAYLRHAEPERTAQKTGGGDREVAAR